MRQFLTNIRHVSREHVSALIAALVIAIIVVSPHIRALQAVGWENFRGFYPTFNDDEITYQARIKEVVDGHPFIGNPYIREHMNDPFIMPPVAEWIEASLVKLTHTSVPFVTSMGGFFLTFLNVLLVYVVFLIALGRNKTIALLYTVLFFIFSLTVMDRPISPQINIIPMLLGLIAIAKLQFESGEHAKKWHVGAGLFTGITCFFYPYFFTTLLVVYGLIVLFRMVVERRIVQHLKQALWFLCAFVPFAALYAFFQFRAGQLPSYAETIARYGLFHTHVPGSFTNVALAVLVGGVLLIAFSSLSPRARVFGAALAVSIPILNWQNVITGSSLQFSSHYQLTTVLTVLMVLALVHHALGKLSRLDLMQPRKLFAVFGIACMVLILAKVREGEYVHIANMSYDQRTLQAQQKKMDVFMWLNEHTEPDSVVYALGGSYDFQIPVYTKDKVFYDFYAALYPAANAETEERWLIQHIFDTTLSTSTIQSDQRDFWGNRFIDPYQSNESRKKLLALLSRRPYAPGQMVDDSYINAVYDQWAALRAEPIQSVLHEYRIDYILVDEDYPDAATVRSRVEAAPGVTLVKDIDGTRIYALSPVTMSMFAAR